MLTTCLCTPPLPTPKHFERWRCPTCLTYWQTIFSMQTGWRWEREPDRHAAKMAAEKASARLYASVVKR